MKTEDNTVINYQENISGLQDGYNKIIKIKDIILWTKKNVGIIYVLMIIPTILFQVLFTPPFQTPDSFESFYRSYQVSNGGIIGKKIGNESGGSINKNMILMSSIFTHIKFHYNQKINRQNISKADKYRWIGHHQEAQVFASFPGTSVYPPFAYIPQSIGIMIGRIFNFSILKTYRLSLFLVSICAIFITYIALQIKSSLNPVIFAIASLSMTTCLYAAIEADALLISIGLLLSSLIASRVYGHRSNRFDLIYITLMITFLAMQKPPYIALVFLIFTPSLDLDNKYNIIKRVSYSAVPVIATALWIIYAKINVWVNIDPSRKPLTSHLIFILENPIRFARTLLATIQSQSNTYTHQLIGVLGWLDAPLPNIYIKISLLALAIAFFISIKNVKIIDWLLISASALISFLFVFLALYADWSPVKAQIIDGVQGRYFTPFLPLIFMMAYPIFFFAQSLYGKFKSIINKPLKNIKIIYIFELSSYIFLYYLFPVITFLFTVNTIIDRYYLM